MNQELESEDSLTISDREISKQRNFRNLRRRKAHLDYNESSTAAAAFEEQENFLLQLQQQGQQGQQQPALLQNQVYDCCFIKVPGSIYQRWKRIRNQLSLHSDEELVVHLLDFYERDHRYNIHCV